MLKISILTGGKDPHYAVGLLSGLAPKNLAIDFIGNEEMQHYETVRRENVVYYNLRGSQDLQASLKDKIVRVLKYYGALLKYAATTDSKLFHILWQNKFEFLDRTLLILYYKAAGKAVVFTAHNVNAGERDGENTLLNRLSLKLMYELVDHIIVHTEKMKQELEAKFNIGGGKVSVVPYGVNNAVPRSALTRGAARTMLGLAEQDKTILFFGNIAPYKGLEHLVRAAGLLKEKLQDFKILIAGGIKKNCEAYWNEMQRMIADSGLDPVFVRSVRYIPDEEIEVYFKAADLLVLPYNHIFQSGIIFLAYSFGLPVVASDVGSLRECVVPGKTGYICNPRDSRDLAQKILLYFDGEMFRNRETSGEEIAAYADEKFSWDAIGAKTFLLYSRLVERTH